MIASMAKKGLFFYLPSSLFLKHNLFQLGNFGNSFSTLGWCFQCRQLSMCNNVLKVKPANTVFISTPAHMPSLIAVKTSISFRGYAKGKDKKKSDKGKKGVHFSDEQLSEIIDVESLRTQFQKPIDKLKDDYFKNLSLRSTTGSIETLKLTFEGKEYILQELAQVVRKNPKTVVINMAVFPQAIPTVIQALQKSGMNLNPQQDGTTLFIPIPKITKEHRENLSKNAKVLFIKCRDSIKDVQNKFVKNIKSKENISKDTAHNSQDQIISLADQYIATAEKILESKQTELIGY